MTFGFSVSPGTETTALLSQTTRTRLPDPYSNCTNEYVLHNDSVRTYSVDYCIDVCLQGSFLKELHCVNNGFRFSQIQLNDTNTFCQNWTQINSDLINKYYAIDSFAANLSRSE